MQTSVEHSVAPTAATRDQQVVRYLATLQQEQDRYLDAIGCARSLLGDERSQLAQMSAVQGRLVRRFFDAQRAILEQRAKVDDAFRSFLMADVDGGGHERQLDALLDEWWQVERRDTTAALAVEIDVPSADLPSVDLPSVDAVADGPSSVDPSQPPRLPMSLMHALDGAGSHDLHRVLDDLVADLDAHLAIAAASTQAPTTAAVVAAPGDLRIIAAPDDDERFQQFWAQPDAADRRMLELAPTAATDTDTRSLAWIPTQVIVPIAAVTVGLSVALLLIG